MQDVAAHHMTEGGHRPTICEQDVKDLFRYCLAQLGNQVFLLEGVQIVISIELAKFRGTHC